MNWLILGIIGFSGLAALICWVLMHIELTRTKRSVQLLRAETEAWQAKWEKEWAARPSNPAPAPPPAAAVNERELNFALRSEIMRQAKAGRGAPEIAARLGVPLAQVRMIFKVYERLSAQAVKNRTAGSQAWERHLSEPEGPAIAGR